MLLAFKPTLEAAAHPVPHATSQQEASQHKHCPPSYMGNLQERQPNCASCRALHPRVAAAKEIHVRRTGRNTLMRVSSPGLRATIKDHCIP